MSWRGSLILLLVVSVALAYMIDKRCLNEQSTVKIARSSSTGTDEHTITRNYSNKVKTEQLCLPHADIQ